MQFCYWSRRLPPLQLPPERPFLVGGKKSCSFRFEIISLSFRRVELSKVKVSLQNVYYNGIILPWVLAF